jgi:hypothetical protein
MFNTAESGTYSVKAQVRAENSSHLTIQIGEEELEAEIPATDSEFIEMNLGEIEMAGAGDLVISFRPVRESWNGMELGQVVLEKQ